MTADGWLSIAVEGQTDAEIVRVLLGALNLPAAGAVYTASKPRITRRLAGYNESAQYRPWYVQIDLDVDFGCAPEAAGQWLPAPSRWMRLGVARPELEAWLLADRVRCARWLGLSATNLPRYPEDLADAKGELLAIVRRHGSALRRRQLLPQPSGGRQVGPEYEAELVRFANDHWKPHEAASRSPSLSRTIARLSELHDEWSTHAAGQEAT